MFVPAPKRTSNGTSDIKRPVVLMEDYRALNLSDAMAHVPSTGVINTGVFQRRRRDNMGKGVVAFKSYKPTTYYSFSGQFTSHSPAIVVTKFNPGGGQPIQYFTTSREFGWGYIGGGGTGMGNPETLCMRNTTSSDVRALANKAIIGNLEARARSEIMVKARNNKMSLGESLAELPKTISLVATTAYDLYFAFKALQRGDMKKVLENLKITHLRDRRGRVVDRATTIEGKWLALRYGWLPLAYDIYAGVNLVNNALADPPGVFTVQRNVREELPFFGHSWNLADSKWDDVSIDYATVCDVQYKYKLRVADATMAFLTSLGLENPLYVAWQLMPYSFVLDWALPVSDWLSALSAPLGLKFVSGYRSTHIEHVSDWSAEGYGHPTVANTLAKRSRASGRFEFVQLDREALSSFPIVSPYVRIPSLSTTRIADAIALIKERKRR